MVHLKTSSIFSAMALAAAICLVPAAAFAAKGGNGNGNGNGNGGGKGNGGGNGGNVTAVADSGSVTVGSSVTIDVLDNDSGGAKTVILVTQGGLGTVEISDARNVSYTPYAAPTATYPYTDSFTYTMTNKKQSSEATGTVTIIVSGPPAQKLVPL
ncbi:MAG: Ig-like domain-containing protein, partial [Alphaproteobacteria bacterium]|nr:Ig-like domain-containing protein [Alphaproteobacteria bacterium]